jgi:acyl-CoA dehydrogenase
MDDAVFLDDDGLPVTERMASVRAATQEVTKRYGRDYWRECIAADRQPFEFLEAMADSGLMGVGLSEDFGGSGGGMLEQSVVTEVLGEAGLGQNYISLPFYGQRLISAHGSPEQQATFLPRTLEGRPNTSFALTEASSGTNAFAMRTTAKPDGGEWVVRGEKVYISGAADSQQMLLVAKTGTKESGRAKLSIFIVDPKSEGITMRPMKIKVLAPEKQYTVSFDDVRIPADALVGQEGAGARSMFTFLNAERVVSSANIIGMGLWVLEKAAEFARTRSPFGVPIGSYQSVQHMLAKPYIGLKAARRLVYDAAAQSDRGQDPSVLALMAKYLASEAANEAIDASVQIHGGAAFDEEADVFPMMEQIRQRRIAPITNQVALSQIAEKVFKLPRGV